MASLSSTGSVSGSSSLGNTSLRGFGGMVSGIQRDEIIEAMTLHTTNRITNQKSEITKLKWKQEAYQGLTDKILDLADNYNSYSSSKGLLDPNIFSRHMITVKGLESSTNLVTASGASNLAANVSLAAVTQMATSTVRQSGSFVGNLTTGLDDLDEVWRSSNLEGTQLVFGTVDRSDPDNPVVSSEATFKFQSTYKDENGKEQTIDYLTTDYRKLAEQLNKSLEQQELTVNGKVTSLEPLRNLTNLRSLRLNNVADWSSPIQSLEVFSGMTKLNSLQIGHVADGVDQSPVAHVSELSIY